MEKPTLGKFSLLGTPTSPQSKPSTKPSTAVGSGVTRTHSYSPLDPNRPRPTDPDYFKWREIEDHAPMDGSPLIFYEPGKKTKLGRWEKGHWHCQNGRIHFPTHWFPHPGEPS